MSLRLKIAGGGGCCPCDQLDGCNCSAVACSMTCEARADVAELCGFEEFVDPTVPPKKYRRRTVTGTLTKKVTNESDCSDDACPGRITLTFAGTIPGTSATFQATGSWVQTGTVGSNVTYQAVGLYAQRDNTPPDVIGARFDIDDGGVNHLVTDGGGFTTSVGHTLTVKLQLLWVTWVDVAIGCVTAGLPDEVTTVDTWDLTQTINGDTCIESEVTGGTHSLPITIGECPGGPSVCYGDAVDVVTDQTTREITGVGCISADKTTWDGTINETLDIEDTEEQAIARTLVGASYVAGGCNVLTAFKTARGAGEFSFAFRSVLVRAIAGSITHPLTAGHTYTFTTKFYHRPLGSSGAFELFLTDEFTFMATGPDYNALTGVYTSQPYAVPIQTDFEAKAVSCRVEEVL